MDSKRYIEIKKAQDLAKQKKQKESRTYTPRYASKYSRNLGIKNN